MSNYNKKTWLNGVDATNQTNMNNIENGIAAVPGVYFIAPYALTTNPTIVNGATLTLTCAGVGGIPSGATGVIIGTNVYSVTAGGTLQIYPAGATAGKYVNITPQWTASNQYTGAGMIVIPLAGGQITCKAIVQNMILQDWNIFAYVI